MPAPTFNLESFYVDVLARLKTSPARTVGMVGSFAEALKRATTKPAAFAIYKGSRSKGKLVQGEGVRKQLRDPLKLFVAIVVDSLGPTVDQAHMKAAAALQPIEDVIVGWTQAGCLSPFIFDGDYFVMADGPVMVYGAEFRTKALDFTT